ncbi:WhiB family transcriptional regulator [Streptomyces sp. NPDC126514]|uniref:WhiB family transcriptional regulator n=1 Tax=Streptomyces sp. NPDC126514 TaxID=3155210 RepID=UPI0033287E8A
MQGPLTLRAPSFLAGLNKPVPCTEHPLIFHPPEDRSGLAGLDPDRYDSAVALCQSCAIASDCRQWARDHGEFGVWGGETDAEREIAGSLPHVSGPRRVRSQPETMAMPAKGPVERPRLTPSEELVLDCLRGGYSRDSLAREVRRSERAVARAIGGLCRKLRTDEVGIVPAAHAAGLFASPRGGMVRSEGRPGEGMSVTDPSG